MGAVTFALNSTKSGGTLDFFPPKFPMMLSKSPLQKSRLYTIKVDEFGRIILINAWLLGD